jgi:V/A-type H+-transporting ATPase subunit K
MDEFLTRYFLEGGLGWAMVGGAAAFGMGCVGSARGIRIAAAQSAGVLSEKPDLFGKLLVLMALPGTQGFYGFVSLFLVSMWTQLSATATGGTMLDANDVEVAAQVLLHPTAGIGIMAAGIAAGFAFWRSAVFQGETSAAAINMVSKQPDMAGKAILMPALVETYALVGLLAFVLSTMYLSNVKLQPLIKALAPLKDAAAAAGVN